MRILSIGAICMLSCPTKCFVNLQWISTSEGLDVDRDALKLIASRSDGSLRDAEMTLDQLSLLGQRISMSLVQELVSYPTIVIKIASLLDNTCY